MTVFAPPCGAPSCRLKCRPQRSWRALVTLTLSASLAVQLLSLCALAGEPASRQNGLKRTATTAKAAVAPAESDYSPTFRQAVQPYLKKYCVECHGRDTHEHDVNFETWNDYAAVLAARKTWEKARKMLASSTMPPADHEPRPTNVETAAVLRWIDQAALDLDCQKIHDPGHVTIRRLNRPEYNNTIRDLLGVPLRPADSFPSDDVGNGFDNMGDVLSLSPLLLEKYLAAAEQASSVALFGIDVKRPPVQQVDNLGCTAVGSTQLVRKPFTRERHFVLPSIGTVNGDFSCPYTGEYVFCAVASARQAGDELVRLNLRLDGTRRVFDITGDGTAARYELRLHLAKGKHHFDASFANSLSEPPAPPLAERARDHKPSGLSKKNQRGRRRELVLERFEFEGPFQVDPRELTSATVATRKRILFCTPGPDGSFADCATRVLTRFATRAFRRPLGQGEIEPYVALTRDAARGGTDRFDRAIQTGLTAILVSPHFLFRIEEQGRAGEGSDPVPIGAYDLASRLSYFLWSSMPDEELFRRAQDGSLLKREILDLQVRRMLRDAKAQALVANFGAQWLNLAQLDTARPSRRVFETFGKELRADMRRETELFFKSIVDEDRSILDLLTGRYTFLNERLAELYGIKGIEGEKFRKVSLDGYPRSGVLTQASILTFTSQPTRTSPVKRGKWILETLLGTAPPPPPPNVPDLAATQKANPKASLREQMALHRQSTRCISCHKVMDPLGFGLENFDGIGRWREKDHDQPVDASGTLPGGESFRGPIELVGVLARRQDDFRRHFAQTLLAYALGRGLEYYDACAVDRIAAATKQGGDRFSILVNEIVHSEPFCKRRGAGDRHGS